MGDYDANANIGCFRRCHSLAPPTIAEGALAVSLHADVAKIGWTYGRTFNKKNEEEARTAALEACRTTPDATNKPQLRQLCVVVGVFHDRCVAVAWDAAAGTPGVGWAISPTKQEAENQALANCREKAGASRRDFCKVDMGHGSAPGTLCDGSAR
ncbi:MAG: DUF4189 domain-containing protein [Xanthobacteraceae bacterium]